MPRIIAAVVGVLAVCAACTDESTIGMDDRQSAWLLIDDFESGLARWSIIDAQNDTDPHVPDPKILEIRSDPERGNHFMLRKPAADGIVGNRKAIGYTLLPRPVEVGGTYSFYTRINVEYFPSNHSFGIGNVSQSDIPAQHYNSFEPMIRVTDKRESNGYNNEGALMVLSGGNKGYSKVFNPLTGQAAKSLDAGAWYELWYVVDNSRREDGGQRYGLYARGGEFETQQLVFGGADFRMHRELPLTFFMTICNTGPHDAPYGNGGVRYDDIYMAPGRNLSSPLQ